VDGQYELRFSSSIRYPKAIKEADAKYSAYLEALEEENKK
jgi:hypothetical protein